MRGRHRGEMAGEESLLASYEVSLYASGQRRLDLLAAASKRRVEEEQASGGVSAVDGDRLAILCALAQARVLSRAAGSGLRWRRCLDDEVAAVSTGASPELLLKFAAKIHGRS